MRRLIIQGCMPVARNAKIASIKIFNSSGKSTLSYIIEGINFAKKNDINIINCSFGGTGWGSSSVNTIKSAMAAVPDMFSLLRREIQQVHHKLIMTKWRYIRHNLQKTSTM